MDDDRKKLVCKLPILSFSILIVVAPLLFLFPFDFGLELSLNTIMDGLFLVLVAGLLLYFSYRGLPFQEAATNRRISYLLQLSLALVTIYALTDFLGNLYNYPDLLKYFF